MVFKACLGILGVQLGGLFILNHGVVGSVVSIFLCFVGGMLIGSVLEIHD